jgi:hypothetical protein
MALVSKDAQSLTVANLAPFTGVNNATARLLKAISAAELASLQEGNLVYVESVRDYWKWLPASTLTSDDITYCAPTVVGAGAGRFERMMFSSPDWMQQGTWVIDAAASLPTSKDENDGLTAATALLTDTERQRRMGENLGLLQEYHFRYISDVPITQEVIIDQTALGGQIFLHSSMTDGEGQSILFGPTAMGAITALNYAAAGGGQPWEMICPAIAGTWSNAGPAGTSLIDKRGRVTAGTAANIGGKFFPIKDLGGASPNAKARLAEPNKVGVYTSPFSTATPSATFTPTAGDTFVIEKLTVIPNLFIKTIHGSNAGNHINGVILDSIEYGTGGRATLTGCRTIVTDGCIRSNILCLLPTNVTELGCQNAITNTIVCLNWSISNGYSKARQILLSTNASSITRYMCQDTAEMVFSSPRGSLGASGAAASGGWLINQIGVFDNTQRPLQVFDKVWLSPTATIWGNNSAAGAEPWFFFRMGMVEYGASSNALPASYFYINLPASGAYIACSTNAGTPRSSVAAFDVTTNLFTANRLISPANLQATVAAGGFGGYFFDPMTTCSFGQAG